ncbi:MAG: TIGR01841 family phasin [Rubrivivax sp.]|nr:TIGR01841 family phasin [Rubrivivax sp.]
MVTSKKAPAKKTARKTAPRAPRKTATAAAPAAKAKAAASPGDLGKLLGRFKLPGIDVAAIVESQRKDMQALADANRQAYEGIKALAERRNEMLKEAFIQWRDAMKGAKGTELLTKQAELARQGVQDAIANVRELAQMEAQSRKEAWKIVQDRFEENLANLKKLLQPK